MHFCVALPHDGHLLVNLNVAENGWQGHGQRGPRLIALAWQRRWWGTLTSFPEQNVNGRAGDLDVRLGANRLIWKNGAFHLSLRTTDIAAELELEPRMLPTVASSISLGGSHGLHWVVLPRLVANGWVRIGSSPREDVENAVAYHDHNWGDFRWGSDLSWEWGYVHARPSEAPWSLVVMRLAGGGGHRTVSQAVLVWRGGTLARVFHNGEVSFRGEGTAFARRLFTLPPVARLLRTGTHCGVPARFEANAAALGDSLTLQFEPCDGARIALPSEADPLRVVVLNETCGLARVKGRVAGETFSFGASSMMEFVRG
jgi:hypothetical protein